MTSDENTLPCTGKLAFDTKKAAKTEATATGWRYGTKLKAYKCSHCGLWHLASDYAGKTDN